MRLILTFALIVLGSWANAQNWMPLADFPSGARDDGCTFTINDIAYSGTGRNTGFAVTSDFYAFDFATEQWAQIASLPDSAKRQYASAVTYDNSGFLFGGINAQGNYLNDLWMYSPVADSWDYLGQAPFSGRSGMQSFVIGDKMFVIGGKTIISDAVNEVWCYSFTTNSWLQKNNMPNDGIWRGFGAVYNNVGIVGMGTDATNSKRGEVYFYDASIDFWTEMTALATDPMNYPAASQIDDRIYIYGGVDASSIYLNDFRYLDLNLMTWNTLNSFPQAPRRGSMAFTSSTDFFMTTGLTTTERLAETWVARNVVGVDENDKLPEIIVYVQEDKLIVPEGVDDFVLCNSLGQPVPLKRISSGQFALPKVLPNGMYIGSGRIGTSTVRSKLIISH